MFSYKYDTYFNHRNHRAVSARAMINDTMMRCSTVAFVHARTNNQNTFACSSRGYRREPFLGDEEELIC